MHVRSTAHIRASASAPGVSCSFVLLWLFHAEIRGPKDSPYEGGIFKVELRVSDRYPFEPPRVSFLTPIYHPNIDSAGIICLDTLNMPPKGSWSPGSNLCTTLASVEQLMAYPNPNDGLVAEVVSGRARLPATAFPLPPLLLTRFLSPLLFQTKHFNDDRSSFNLKAAAMTRQFAMGNSSAATEAAAAAAASSSAANVAAASSAASAAAPSAASAPASAAAPTASPPVATPVATAAPSLSGSKRSAELDASTAGSDSSSTTAHADATAAASEPNAKKPRVEAPASSENSPPQHHSN